MSGRKGEISRRKRERKEEKERERNNKIIEGEKNFFQIFFS